MKVRIVFWQEHPGPPRDSLVLDLPAAPRFDEIIDLDPIPPMIVREVWWYPLDQDDPVRVVVHPAAARKLEP